MASTAITKIPLLLSATAPKPLAPSSFSFAGSRSFASVSSSSRHGGSSLLSGGRDGAGAGFAAAADARDTAGADSDVILLHVGGMMCDGCAASVKRILESQHEVTSASVNFKKATAIVQTTPEAKVTEDWQKFLGVKLANHLGTCGFESRLQE